MTTINGITMDDGVDEPEYPPSESPRTDRIIYDTSGTIEERIDRLLVHARNLEQEINDAETKTLTALFEFKRVMKQRDDWKEIAQKLAYHVQCNDSWCGIRNSKCDACKVLETFKQLDAPAEPSNVKSSHSRD